MSAADNKLFGGLKLKITVEFSGSHQQKIWTEERLTSLLKRKIAEPPTWTGREGHNLPAEGLEILVDIGAWVHPDYGPETTITLSHDDLHPTQKQLLACWKWINAIAERMVAEIKGTLRSLDISDQCLNHKVQMVYSVSTRYITV